MIETVMVPWRKRLFYSVISVVAAVIVCYFCMALWDIVHHPGQMGNFELGGLLRGLGFLLFCCIPGWVIALPFVLRVTDPRGWRVWMWFGLGASIGPVLLLGIASYFVLSDPGHTPGFFFFEFGLKIRYSGVMEKFYLGTGISSLTTLSYLLLFLRAQKTAANIASADKGDVPAIH